MTLRTEYEFVLPRGFVDDSGAVHRRGVMRLATARDELEPLRDPTINGADDPRLTILVLARVVRTLGSLELVTPREIEELFAADLAYLQDFYGVINFGTPDDIEALLEAQREMSRPVPVAEEPKPKAEKSGRGASAGDAAPERPAGRRAAIKEMPAGGR
ncbi:MAG: hypothetical protein QOG64_304 [Acidimicrobiaceae bacterium]|jgi:hypothetical protein|nr:hypothetical protein [Acidimicrobiaceae bacterium]MEA2620221.1 hypothetical protein [Chloroflexota bacterium]